MRKITQHSLVLLRHLHILAETLLAPVVFFQHVAILHREDQSWGLLGLPRGQLGGGPAEVLEVVVVSEEEGGGLGGEEVGVGGWHRLLGM